LRGPKTKCLPNNDFAERSIKLPATNLSEHLRRLHPMKVAAVTENRRKMDEFVSRSDKYDPASSRKIELDKYFAKLVFFSFCFLFL